MAANKWKTGEKKLRMKEVSNVLNANCMNAFEFVFVYNLELMRTRKKSVFIEQNCLAQFHLRESSSVYFVLG